jgi:2-C-methyl-D-erythritol 4-phosphate cytidylyltransferase
VQPLLECGAARVVVGLPADRLDDFRGRLEVGGRVLCVAGGDSRQETVRRCLEAAPGEGQDLVLVHDGARPAVAVEDVRAVIEAAAEADGAVLGRPVSDTLKRVTDGVVTSTVNRQGLYRAETPQVFRRVLLADALSKADRELIQATDEATLLETLQGVRLRLVEARKPNPKLTFLGDLALIGPLIEARRKELATTNSPEPATRGAGP